MSFQPGDIVSLKSGGQFMTVSGVSEDGVECIWIGEEGDFFRENVPAAVLRVADILDEEDDTESEDEAEGAGEEADGEETRKIA